MILIVAHLNARVLLVVTVYWEVYYLPPSPSLISLMVYVAVKQHRTKQLPSTELRSCVNVRMAVLGSPSLYIVLMVSVDKKWHWTWSAFLLLEKLASQPYRKNNVRLCPWRWDVTFVPSVIPIRLLYTVHIRWNVLELYPRSCTFHMILKL